MILPTARSPESTNSDRAVACNMSSGARKGVAAHWHVLDNLWRPSDEDRAKTNVLDCIRSSSEGLLGWLFTAVDGTLKSKNRSKWNYSGIIDRICWDCPLVSEDALYSHYTRDGFTWHQTTNEVVKEFVTTPFPGVMVTFSHIKSPSKPLYIEQTFSHEHETDMTFKVTTHLLAGAVPSPSPNPQSSGGKAPVSSAASIIPPQRLQSMNKAVNESAKSFIVDLVKTLEKRGGRRISKLVCVLLMESDVESPKLWLHHVKEIAYPKTSKSIATQRGSERMSQYDRKSVTCSEVSYNMASFQRFSKCQGDFCSYAAEDEEAALVSTEPEEDRSSVIDESKKARILIRRTIGKDYSDIKASEKKPEVPREGAQHEGNDASHVIVRPRTGDVTASSEAAVGERFLEEDPSPEVSAFVAAGKRSVARQVPFKSIALARHDMSEIERGGGVHYSHASVPWPELLYHWYWRAGRAYAQKKGSVPVPQSSGFGIAAAQLTGGAASGPASLPPVPEEGVAAADTPAGVGADAPPLGLLRPPVHGLHTAEKDSSRGGANAAGHLSWYYSQARVCETCYQVYRDVDRRREERQLKLLRAQRKAADAEEEVRGRETELRIFEQRRFVSRLTANPNKKTKPQEPRQEQGSGSARVAAASCAVVPPVPWRLTDSEHGAEYSHYGSSLTRKLQARVQEVQGLNEADRRNKEHENMRRKIIRGMQNPDHDGDGADVDFEAEELQRWREMTGADRLPQTNAGKVKKKTMRMIGPGGIGKKISVRDFDVDKLLHPWQRSMNDMRQQLEAADGDVSMALRKMQLQKLKGKKSARRAQSLPPLQQQSSLMNTSQITMDSALFDNDYGDILQQGSVASVKKGQRKGSKSKGHEGHRGFVGLGDRNELYDEVYNSTKRATIQISKNDYSGAPDGAALNRFAAKNSGKTFSLSITSRTEKLDQLPSVQRVGETLSPVKNRPMQKLVSFDEGSSASTGAGGVSVQEALRGAKEAAGVYGDDDDGDDDDDEDDAIGWSPFVIPQTK